MNYKERNWLAGFTDGEGCIDIYLQQKKRDNKIYYQYVQRVVLANTNKKVIEYIDNITDHLGYIYCQKKKKPCKSCYIITFGKKRAIKFIKLVYPYLKIKKRQTKICLDLYKTTSRTKKKLLADILAKRKYLYKQCKKLNKRGI